MASTQPADKEIRYLFCEIGTSRNLWSTKIEGTIYDGLSKYIMDCKDFEILKEQRVDSYSGLGKKGIIIAFTRMKALHNTETLATLHKTKIDDSKVFVRPISDSSHNSIDSSCYPIIIIGLEDFVDNILDLESSAAKQIEMPCSDTKHKILNELNLDPRVAYWDSSIWQRYVPLNEQFSKILKRVLEEISKNYAMNLYNLNITREFIEFQTRMLINSYLASMGSRAHSFHIIPFKFHSERQMGKKADDLFQNISSLKLRWRVLLIDDYASVDLVGSGGEKGPNKKEIIESLLESKEIFVIDCTMAEPGKDDSLKLDVDQSIILNSIFMLRNKIYDLIFLDYLLGEVEIRNHPLRFPGKKTREFGNELIYLLQQQPPDKLNLKFGPLRKLWFFPISAFSYAMMDELKEKGISYVTREWHLANGADPVNTPHLFRRKLFRFLIHQFDEIVGNRGAKIGEADFMDQLSSLFIKFEHGKVQEASKSIYSEMVEITGKVDEMRNNSNIELPRETQSRLIDSVLHGYFKDISQSFLQHMQSLIYKLPYGAGLNWPEMWEEYIFIKNYLFNNFEKKPDFLDKIMDHLLRLQKHYR